MADEQKPDGPPAPSPRGRGCETAGYLQSPPRLPRAGMPLLPSPRPRWRPLPGKANSPAKSRNASETGFRRPPRTWDRISSSAKPEAAIPLIEFLKLEADFDYLVDITAVDWPKRPERFDLVYILYSFARNERIRVKTYIAEATSRRPRWACT